MDHSSKLTLWSFLHHQAYHWPTPLWDRTEHPQMATVQRENNYVNFLEWIYGLNIQLSTLRKTHVRDTTVCMKSSPRPTVTRTLVNRDFLLLGQCNTRTSLFDANLLLSMVFNRVTILSPSSSYTCCLMRASRFLVLGGARRSHVLPHLL